jgi:hypothetical protein
MTDEPTTEVAEPVLEDLLKTFQRRDKSWKDRGSHWKDRAQKAEAALDRVESVAAGLTRVREAATRRRAGEDVCIAVSDLQRALSGLPEKALEPDSPNLPTGQELADLMDQWAADGKGESATLTVGGNRFHCDCLCNVFTRFGNMYRCNACRTIYGGVD